MTEQGDVARRFLVVEDEVVIAMLLDDYLSEIGCSVAWHAESIQEALSFVESEPDIDGAILDMNLHGQSIDPVAAALFARDIPFCFVTGYGAGAATKHPQAPIINKPFNIQSVHDTIARLISTAG
jgi:CheY-like chemotaxis protein